VRLVVALIVIAVACAGALYVHQRHVNVYGLTGSPECIVVGGPYDGFPTSSTTEAGCFDRGPGYRWQTATRDVVGQTRPSWEDPVAVFLVIGGLAGAASIFATSRSAQHA
jgi:hypothetical protein